MEFNDYGKMLPIPFTVIADFECTLPKIDIPAKSGKQTKIERHVPSGYAYVIVSTMEGYEPKKVLYRGEDCTEHFPNSLIEDSKWMLSAMKVNKPMVMTEAQKAQHKAAVYCFICGKDLPERLKVVDHDHHTGLYRVPVISNTPPCPLKIL